MPSIYAFSICLANLLKDKPTRDMEFGNDNRGAKLLKLMIMDFRPVLNDFELKHFNKHLKSENAIERLKAQVSYV